MNKRVEKYRGKKKEIGENDCNIIFQYIFFPTITLNNVCTAGNKNYTCCYIYKL